MNLISKSDEQAQSLQSIMDRVEVLTGGNMGDTGKTPVAHFGKVACIKELRLSLVPFFEPCVIVVLSGTKHLGEKSVGPGGCLGVPAPSNFHMTNEPDPETGSYIALVFPFDLDDVAHVRTALMAQGKALPQGQNGQDIVTYAFDGDTLEALDHYLQSGMSDSAARVQHRKREILLILAERDPRILTLAGGVADWAQRLRTLFAKDPAHPWAMEEVCQRLAVTESTLRRSLRKEDTSFRDVLSAFRLSNALMSVLMSPAPIYQIAHDNGFQSVSRFTENFRKRFDATPSEVRSRLPESGQMTESG